MSKDGQLDLNSPATGGYLSELLYNHNLEMLIFRFNIKRLNLDDDKKLDCFKTFKYKLIISS